MIRQAIRDVERTRTGIVLNMRRHVSCSGWRQVLREGTVRRLFVPDYRRKHPFRRLVSSWHLLNPRLTPMRLLHPVHKKERKRVQRNVHDERALGRHSLHITLYFMYEAFICFVEMHFRINETAQITMMQLFC